MRQDHQDLFIDLLIEKVKSMPPQDSAEELCVKTCHGELTTTKAIQDAVDAYEERIEALRKDSQFNNDRARSAEKRLEELESAIANHIKDRQHQEIELNDLRDKLSKALSVNGNNNQQLIDSLNNEIKDLKTRNKGLQTQINANKVHIDYAKSQDFHFPGLEKMKEALEQSLHISEEKPAEDKEELMVQPSSDEVFYDPGKHSMPCPFNMHDRSGSNVFVADTYCRKRCGFNHGTDTDQGIVHCGMQK